MALREQDDAYGIGRVAGIVLRKGIAASRNSFQVVRLFLRLGAPVLEHSQLAIECSGDAPKIAAQIVGVTHATATKEIAMANAFIGFLETVGKDFLKGLEWAVKYAIPVEKLVALLFPAAAPATTEIADATTLIQNAVILVEQKYAASGVQNGTGAQKLAEVITLTGPVVTSLLQKAGIAVDATYLQNLINAVVAILNVQTPPAA